MSPRRAWLALLNLGLGLAVAACSGGAPTAPSIDPAVHAQLRSDVSAVASAVAAGDSAAAQHALDALDAHAAAAHGDGKLSADKLAEIQAAEAALQADLAAGSSPSPTPSATTTAAPSTDGGTPPAPPAKPKDDKGKGKDKDKGGKD